MTKDDIEKTLAQKDANPYVEGHLRAITLVQQLAPQPDLIPDQVNNIFDFDAKFEWLKRLHRNVMRPIAEHGVKTLDPSFIHPTDVGTYRSTHKTIKRLDENQNLINVELPDPIFIRELLTQWGQDLAEFHSQMKRTIEYGRYSQDDVKAFVDKAYEANLKLCCIDPFEDGTARVARLVENLFRLNWGLPWKVIKLDDKDKLLEDVRAMQSRF